MTGIIKRHIKIPVPASKPNSLNSLKSVNINVKNAKEVVNAPIDIPGRVLRNTFSRAEEGELLRYWL